MPNAASTKAQIVKALKAMAMDLQYGDQVKSSYMYINKNTPIYDFFNIMGSTINVELCFDCDLR